MTTIHFSLIQTPAEENREAQGSSGYSSALILGIVVVAVAIALVLWRSTRKKAHNAALSHSGTDPQSVKIKDAAAAGEAESRPTTVSGSSPAIFISYRRFESGDVTGRIYDRLTERFGKQSIFKDVDSIPLGVDFRRHLSDSVGKCNVLLAIIGKNWLTGLSEKAGDRARDYAKIEVEAALQRDIPVVPILVHYASLPAEEELPESLRSLAYRNAIAVRPDPDFHQDMDRLIQGIEGYLKKK